MWAQTLAELGRQPSLWHHLRWVYRNRHAIRKTNRWLNVEDGTIKYRGAEYCIDCRTEIMGGFMCESCASNQGLVGPEPDMALIELQQRKWKAVAERGMDEGT